MLLINDLINYCVTFFISKGLLFGFLLIVLESFISILPLSAFVILNVNAYGLFLGILISWIATCIGSYFCYLFFYYLNEKVISKSKMNKFRNSIFKFRNISFSNLVLLISMPYSPSFIINMLCGMSQISLEKFIIAIIIGKLFVIIFWGYIGRCFLANLIDIFSLLYVGISLLLAYIISIIINKKFIIE